MIRFAILLPTIRDNAGFVHEALHNSLTYPSDVFTLRDIMGQGAGHLQVLNRSLRYLDPEWHTYAVKMDDDIILRKGWQNAIVQAFKDVPKLGVCGLDVSHTADGRAYMVGGMPNRRMYPQQTIGKTVFRELHDGNVGGLCMASPVELMLEIGTIPIVGDNKYPFYADGLYNLEARKRGYRAGYVKCESAPVMVVHKDPEQYIADKGADTKRIRADVHELLTEVALRETTHR